MAINSAPNAHIPRGVADYFWNDASTRRQLETTLLDTFRRWGYHDIIPPTLEYADTLRVLSNTELRPKIYSFLDHDGNTLALRYDMTVAVARLVGTRLHDAPMPQRFGYSGNVFRHTEPQGGQQREFWQAGVELVGADSANADAEVLALTAKALQRSGLRDFRLVVGQIRYFRGLLHELQLTPPAQEMLQHAVLRKSEPELDEFLRETALRTQQRHTVEQLFDLHGSDALAVIQQADRLCLNYEMHVALKNLRAIYRVLTGYDVAHHVHLDLTEIRDLGYYTGVTFQAFTPETGFTIAAGGRYDDLVGTFGPPLPAMGMALGVDRILLARHLQAGTAKHHLLPPLHCLVAANHNPRCYQIVQEWRNRGLRVAMDVNGRQGAELWQAAQSANIPCALAWAENGFTVYDNAQQSDSGHFVAERDVEQLFQTILQKSESLNGR